VAGVTILGLGMAILLNQALRGIGFFRTVFYFPVVVDWVIASIVWLFLLEPSIGLVNQFLLSWGYQPQPFFNSTKQAMPIIIIMSIWKDVAYYGIIYLAGLQDIPPTLIEAAQLDGANRWQVFRHVTLPWLAPVSLLVIILASINSLRVFNQIYVATQGGPLNSTTSIMYYLYNVAFRYLQMGYGSAISLIFFFMVLLFVVIQRRLLGSYGRTT
jgi:ABC-type sugar transport system permease subunit